MGKSLSSGKIMVTRSFLDHVIKTNDEELTENGLQLKRLAERMNSEDYEMTDADLQILDDSWRKIWK